MWILMAIACESLRVSFSYGDQYIRAAHQHQQAIQPTKLQGDQNQIVSGIQIRLQNIFEQEHSYFRYIQNDTDLHYFRALTRYQKPNQLKQAQSDQNRPKYRVQEGRVVFDNNWYEGQRNITLEQVLSAHLKFLQYRLRKLNVEQKPKQLHIITNSEPTIYQRRSWAHAAKLAKIPLKRVISQNFANAAYIVKNFPETQGLTLLANFGRQNTVLTIFDIKNQSIKFIGQEIINGKGGNQVTQSLAKHISQKYEIPKKFNKLVYRMCQQVKLKFNMAPVVNMTLRFSQTKQFQMNYTQYMSIVLPVINPIIKEIQKIAFKYGVQYIQLVGGNSNFYQVTQLFQKGQATVQKRLLNFSSTVGALYNLTSYQQTINSQVKIKVKQVSSASQSTHLLKKSQKFGNSFKIEANGDIQFETVVDGIPFHSSTFKCDSSSQIKISFNQQSAIAYQGICGDKQKKVYLSQKIKWNVGKQIEFTEYVDELLKQSLQRDKLIKGIYKLIDRGQIAVNSNLISNKINRDILARLKMKMEQTKNNLKRGQSTESLRTLYKQMFKNYNQTNIQINQKVDIIAAYQQFSNYVQKTIKEIQYLKNGKNTKELHAAASQKIDSFVKQIQKKIQNLSENKQQKGVRISSSQIIYSSVTLQQILKITKKEAQNARPIVNQQL